MYILRLALACSGSDDAKTDDRFALMLAGEVRKGHWSVLGDVDYLDFSDTNGKTVSINLPDGGSVAVVDAGTETGLKGSLVTLAPGYSFYSTLENAMDVFAGLPNLNIRTMVDWRITGPVGAFGQRRTT